MSARAALATSLRRHERILREGAWVVVGQVAAAAGFLIGTRVLTELAAPHIFGAFILLFGFYYLGRSVFCVSILQAALRFDPELSQRGERGRLRRTVSRLLVQTMAVPVAAVLLGGLLYSLIRDKSFLPFVVLAGLLCADAARSYEVVGLIAVRRQKAAALMDAAEALLRPALAITTILVLGPSTVAILLAYLIASGSVFLAARVRLAREETGIAPDTSDPRLSKEILIYALPLMPMAAVTWISGLSDRYIVGGILGREQVGIYAAAYGLMSTPFIMAQGVIDRTLTPPYFAAVSAGDIRGERRVFRALLTMTIGVCGAGILLFIALRTWIADLLLAKEYRASMGLMPWIALGNGLLVTEYCLAKYRYAHKQTRDIFLVQVVGATAALLATVPLVRAYGAWGAAIACPVYYGIQLAFSVTLRRMRTRNVAQEPA